MKKSKINFVLSLLFPLAVGGLSAILTRDNMNLYQEIAKPPLAPPSVVFPIAWTVLYLMMGAASYLVLVEEKSASVRCRAYIWYLLQLAMNFLWSIFFFDMKLYLFSLLWLIAMYVVIIICTRYFFRSNRWAGWMMVPYNMWMAFAAYLNLAIVVMN